MFVRMFTCWLHLCLCLFTFSEVRAVTSSDPCDPGNHHVISDVRRSTRYKAGPSDPLLCDKNTIKKDTWYRFTHPVGDVLPGRCVSPGYCGTQAPVWLNGAHPTGGGEVTRTVCANFGNHDNCCSWQAEIKVKRCHGNGTISYVYRLVEPPGCPIAYCAGDKLLCSSGLMFNGFTGKCEQPHPPLRGASLSQPIIEGATFVFYCHLDTDDVIADNGGRFMVEFRADDVTISDATVRVSAPDNKAKMAERHLRGNMGKRLTCRARSVWEGYDIYSPWIYSSGYFAGIKVIPSILYLNEAMPTIEKVTLTSTVPPTCDDSSTRGQCNIHIRVTTSSPRLMTSQGGATSCVYQISSYSWDERKNVTENVMPLDVTLSRDVYVNGANKLSIEFEPVDNFVSGSVWSGFKLPSVTIFVAADSPFGTCSVTSDPRIRTWDGTRYDILSYLGEFVLWENLARDFEAHIRFWVCRPEGPIERTKPVACACGVAIRERGSLLYVDMCHTSHGQTPRPKVIQGSQGHLKGASITRDVTGTVFEIIMPSGAGVRLDIQTWGMNVFASAPSEDRNHTSGLCGTFDGNHGNDFIPRDAHAQVTRDVFIKSWRISRGSSLFDRIHHPPNVTHEQSQCTCTGYVTTPCDVSKSPHTVSSRMTSVTPMIRKNFNSHRGKRDIVPDDDLGSYTDDLDEGDAGDFDYSHAPLPVIPWRWPTISGITEAEAREACEAAVRRSTMFIRCHQVLGEDVMDPVQSCVDDIKIMDDVDWSRNAAREMENTCMMTLMMNDEDAAEDMLNDACSPDCLRHGTCTEGLCVCPQGYEGPDCSMVTGTPPVARYIPNHGLCDVMTRPCQKIRVIAEGLYDNPNLSCKITQILVEADGTQTVLRNSTLITNATLVSSTEVICPVPAPPVRQVSPLEGRGRVVHGALVSVSNDGRMFSSPLFLTVYDSTCMTCYQNASCTHRNDACLINGHCYAEGDADPRNWCKICDTIESKKRFIGRFVNTPPVFETPSNIYKLINESLALDLQARDPEGRTVNFTIDFTTNPKVTVDTNGTLRWLTHKDESVRLEISITDECGARTVQDLDLMTIECNCSTHGRCVIDPGKPRGQGYYYCDCAPGWTGDLCQREVIECASGPCLHGACMDMINSYYCKCDIGYHGELCDEGYTTVAMTTDQVTAALPPIGEFTPWGEWRECSKPCDYGIKSRNRWCPRLPCDGAASQTRLCNQFNCPETPSEKEEGVILVVKDTSVIDVRLHEEDLMMTVAKAFNSYYLHNAGCCEAVGIHHRTLSGPVVVKEDFYVAGGYPKMVKGNVYIWKIMTMVDIKLIRESCSGNATNLSARVRRDLRHSFLPPEVTKQAILACKDDIKMLYKINIDHLILPSDEEYVTIILDTKYVIHDDPQEVTSPETTSNVTLVVGACVGTVASVALMILVTIIYLKRSKRGCDKRGRAPSTGSMKYRSSSGEIEVVYDNNSTTTNRHRTTSSHTTDRDGTSLDEPVDFFRDHYVTLDRSDDVTVTRAPRHKTGGGNNNADSREEMMHVSSISSADLDLHLHLGSDVMSESDTDDVFDHAHDVTAGAAVFACNPAAEGAEFPRGALRLSTRSTDKLIPWK